MRSLKALLFSILLLSIHQALSVPVGSDLESTAARRQVRENILKNLREHDVMNAPQSGERICVKWENHVCKKWLNVGFWFGGR